jgi:hypothetical protein
LIVEASFEIDGVQPEVHHIEKGYESNNKDTRETDEHRESLVEVISISDLGEFYGKLNSLLGTTLAPLNSHNIGFKKLGP